MSGTGGQGATWLGSVPGWLSWGPVRGQRVMTRSLHRFTPSSVRRPWPGRAGPRR